MRVYNTQTNTNLVDSHCHFNSLSEEIREEVVSSCGGNYIFIDSSIDTKSSLESVALSERHDFIYTSLGFHPFCGAEFSGKVIDEYERLIKENKKIVAVGEIGLDYKAEISLEEQESILCDFISLAKRENLTVVIHNRLDTFKVLEVLDKYFSTYQKVVFHCFSYSEEFLKEILQRGGFVSFSLNILREKKSIISSLNKCPLENLLLETDSPYMRIKNEPSTPLDVEKVYSFAAAAKGLEEEQLKKIVLSNAKRAFFLK